MEILGVFGGWGVPFPLPPSCIKGGPGAESQAGTNREQSKHEQTVNKRRPLHGVFTLCPMARQGRGGQGAGALCVLLHPYRTTALGMCAPLINLTLSVASDAQKCAFAIVRTSLEWQEC